QQQQQRPQHYPQQQQQQQQRPQHYPQHHQQQQYHQPPQQFLSQQYLPLQHQQQPQHQQPQPQQYQPQYQQQGAPSFAYDPPYSPSVQSDSGAGRPMAQQAPQYPRASSSAANLYPQQHANSQMAPQPRPVSGLPIPYPSAMVVGGGMPSNNRLVPSQALMNAASTADISRQQREHDFTNALGRRRPTHGSVSSNGSASTDHYRPKAPVSTLPELPPFNGNTGSDYGGQPGRYRSSLATQPTVDMRVGRSASSASSSSGGYRGGFAPSPFASQRRPLQPMPEQHLVRKQPSTISVASASNGYDATGSPDLRHAHPGSRSAPDLNLDSMKSAIMAVSHDLDQNPVPQIPTSYAQTHSSHAQTHSSYQHLGPPPTHPLAAASSLSILTDISQSDVSQ
ncbi:hypothetical protein LPJ71_011035, partial [Coemansia sp. S17]